MMPFLEVMSLKTINLAPQDCNFKPDARDKFSARVSEMLSVEDIMRRCFCILSAKLFLSQRCYFCDFFGSMLEKRRFRFKL